MIQDIAILTKCDPFEVRRRNLYRDGDTKRNTTPYGQVVRDHVLEETLSQIEIASHYQERSKAVQLANQDRSRRIKGIAMCPIKFGISFTTKFLNQGNALIHVFTDGSIQVSTGGTEMGQGLNTKLRQLVADEFGVPVRSVVVMTTSTEKNHNTSPTAASAGTDLNGQAALIACARIRGRLAEFAAQRLSRPTGCSVSADDICFEDEAVFDRRSPQERISFRLYATKHDENESISEIAAFTQHQESISSRNRSWCSFYYFTTGAAVAEVTVDRWTGEYAMTASTS